MQYLAIGHGKKFSIEIEDKPISGGGQGNIYRISYPDELSDCCVKLYKTEKHAKENENRLKYMINNRPDYTEMQKIRICWPDYLLYSKNKNFVGYIMPLAFNESRDLKIIETYTFNQTIAQKYPKYKNWNKFDYSNKDGFKRRLQMIKNWALAVDIIHKTKKYVLIDIKPENVLATDSGLISIVDTDSFQINDGHNIFKGPVATPEYFAKLAKQIQQQGALQTTYCDMFALGVSFYKILTGTHPFAGFRLLPPYDTDEYCNIASHIDAGLFAFGNKRQYIEFLNDINLHKRFLDLPPQIKTLFLRTFNSTTGYPNAEEWVNVLDTYIHKSAIKQPRKFIGDLPLANTEARCLCILIFDVSGSMSTSIDVMNEALGTFVENLWMGIGGFCANSKESVELGIIQFDSKVSIVRPPHLVTSIFDAPILQANNGKTNTAAALDTAINMVESRKNQYKKVGLPYYRPWIVLITDGNPDPYNEHEICRVASKMLNGVKNKKFIFNVIGIGKRVDEAFLKYISSDNYKRISRKNFSSMFQTLSCSLNIMSKGFDNDNPLDGLDDIVL